jgi:hypothetical protein
MSSKGVIFLANILDVEKEISLTEDKGVCVCVCVGACIATNFGLRFIIPGKRAPIKPLQMTSS